MTQTKLTQRIAALDKAGAAASLKKIRRGIEKESLRVDAHGQLAQTTHPKALGSALTHPFITTDYSESLLELITPASTDIQAPLDWLERLHRHIYQQLTPAQELIWNSSMPCPLGDDSSIPIARYGSSNGGRMKHIYRQGLGHRYGRHMQTIAGIHYNFSFPTEFWDILQSLEGDARPSQAFISDRYFGLVRNFQRHAWLLLYLFGASPALCADFLNERPNPLLERHGDTLLRPYATSLRMSDLGYQNNVQSGLQVSVDDLDSYIDTLTYAISTTEPSYQQLGVCDGAGNYRQLNANILQIENEFYSSIRPKRNTQANERPTLALNRRGVEYIEMRVLDLNPLEPLGIDAASCRFLDIFATFCLLEASPSLSHCDINASKQNIRQVAYDGRRPGLELWNCGEGIGFSDWACQLCERMAPIAELLDSSDGGNAYATSLAAQLAKIRDPGLTPSAQIEAEVRKQGFFGFAMQQAHQAQAHFATPPTASEQDFFATEARNSLATQHRLEADSTSFEDYLADYFQGIASVTSQATEG